MARTLFALVKGIFLLQLTQLGSLKRFL